MDAWRDGGIHPIPWNCLMKRSSGTAVAQAPLVTHVPSVVCGPR